jgi:uncharacterized protein (TIGR01777 family)
MRYLITGGTGFIGAALCHDLLRAGHQVAVLTRSPAAAQRKLPPQIRAVVDPEELDGADAVVNLAGESIVGARWSAARKRLLLDSRIGTTRRLLNWVERLPRRPAVLVSGSAIGYYGPRGDEELGEDAPAGEDFGAALCQAWEAEALRAETLGLRVCRLRIGVVLGPGGGALSSMLTPFRLGLGGPMGNGRQWMSWVHRADLIALIRWLAEDGARSGAYNGTAPQPATNAAFSRALGRVLHRPAVMATPAFALRLLFGEMAGLLLTGQKVLPRRALAQGFEFRFPALETALQDVLTAR